MKFFLNKHITQIFFFLLLMFIIINITKTPGFFDSAEFAISYINNSIVHPPSYPFTYIFNKAIGSILPFNIMWKLHFVNALYSFIALILFYLYLSFYTKNKFIKIIFVLQLFLSDFLLNYTFNLEVYSLLFLFTALFFYIYEKTLRDTRYIHLLIFIFSMGVIVHQLFIFLIPLLFYAYFMAKKFKYILFDIILAVLPLFVYFIFWGLSKNIPLMNWEDPHNLSGLLTLFFRPGYKNITFYFHIQGLHIVGLNILKNMGIIFFFIPIFFYKKNKYKILFVLGYLLIISLSFYNIADTIFDWTAFFIPVYIIFYGISVEKLDKFKYRSVFLIFPLVLFLMNSGYLPYGKYPYPNAYFNDINKKMIGKKNILFVNDDSMLFISNLKLLQKETKFIPIIPTFINFDWYIKSMEKYTKLKYPKFSKSKRSLYKFMVELRKLNPEYTFYNLGIVDRSFYEIGKIPPTLLVKFYDKDFEIIDYQKMDFLSYPPRNTFEYKFYRSQYEIYIKNLVSYYLNYDLNKSLYYLEMLNKNTFDYHYLKGMILQKKGNLIKARKEYKNALKVE
ncbi:DUF2723 domain-containing protein [bacterium]|nr:DUF2723 domain-containing protein [bacterium]